MKKLILFLSVVFISGFASAQSDGELGVQPAWENPYQNMGSDQLAPGYSELEWSPDKILQLRLREGMVTVINFPAWETIKDAYVGEADFFEVKTVAKNTLMATPTAGYTGSDTNMIVFGVSGNKYAFYLKSEGVNTETITNTIVNIKASQNGKSKGKFSSGSGVATIPGIGSQNSTKGTYMDGEDYSWIKTIPVDPTEFRFDLDIFVPNPDDYIIAPERVWRDKIFTYIDFGEKAVSMYQRPVVSILVEGGEAPVSFRSEGPNSRLMVIEGIGDMVLRNGQRIVCIKKRDKPFLVSQYPTGEMIGQETYQPKAQPKGDVFEDVYTREQTYRNPLIAEIPHQTYEPVMRVDYPAGYFLPTRNTPFVYQYEDDVAIELAKSGTIAELQKVWNELISNENFNEIVSGFDPYYTVDTNTVDELGNKPYHGAEVYRLRIKPARGKITLEQGSEICTRLSKKNINCSVVRIQ